MTVEFMAFNIFLAAKNSSIALVTKSPTVPQYALKNSLVYPYGPGDLLDGRL